MKKTLIAVIITICCIQFDSIAQKPQPRVGLVAGVTSSNFMGEMNGSRINYEARAGYTFGMLVDVPIRKSRFSFQPGLHYVQKGAETAETNDQLNYIALRYLEFQGNFIYDLTKVRKESSLFIGLGPAVSAGLPSKSVVKNKRTDSKTEDNIVFGNESLDDLRGIDYGVNMLAGFRFKKGFMFSFNYNLGVHNLLPGDPDNSSLRNGSFAFRIGWLFKNTTK